MKRKNIIGALSGIVLLGAIAGSIVYVKETQFNAKEEIVKVELGTKISKEKKQYIDATTKYLDQTTIDFSKIDETKVGSYKVAATCKKKKVEFNLKIVDTTAPEIKLTDKGTAELATVINKEIKATDLIESIEDKGGIKSISFSESQIEIKADDKLKDVEKTLAMVGVKYAEPGTKKNTITVTDNNGNKTEKTVKIYVAKDYLTLASGFKDWTLEQGSTVNFMEGITHTPDIKEITVNAAGADINTVGDYKVAYKIVGDDNKTILEKVINVKVIDAVEAQASANAGGTVYTSGGTKSAYVPPASSSQASSGARASTSSGTKSSGGSSASTASGGGSSSGGNTSSAGVKPGQSYTGTSDGGGYIDGGDGNTYEGGTWDPNQ